MSIVLRDYRHARATFIDRQNPSLIPKSQFLFHVYIELNVALSQDPEEKTFSILVKSVELPKFSVETKNFNAYNRPNIVQTKIKYESITIKFHDDSNNIIRNLWQNYYQFYYQDSKLGVDNGAPAQRYLFAHKYKQELPVNFGYKPNGEFSEQANLINNIRIYSLHGGQYSLYVLVNPIITKFKHSSHDYEQSTLLEHEMTVDFETVLYSTGSDINEVKGFTEVGYDKTQSPIETGQESNANSRDLSPNTRSLKGDMSELINNRPEAQLTQNDDNFDFGNFLNNSSGFDVIDPKIVGSNLSQNFAGTGSVPMQINATNENYESNPVTQPFFNQLTSKGLPVLNPTPSVAPKNLLSANEPSIPIQTNQQNFPSQSLNLLNASNLNKKISNLSVEKNYSSQQSQNGINVLTALENQRTAISGLPKNSNTELAIKILNGQIADTQKNINQNQENVSYLNNEINQASIDLEKFVG